jgi:hypothetical protein
MGRGRAKAKQTKVARELKYSSPQTDFTQLQRELSHAPTDLNGSHVADDSPDDWTEDDDWRR